MLADYPIGFYMYVPSVCVHILLLLVGMRLCRSSNNDNKDLCTYSKCVCVYIYMNRLALLLHSIRMSLYTYIQTRTCTFYLMYTWCIVTQCS